MCLASRLNVAFILPLRIIQARSHEFQMQVTRVSAARVFYITRTNETTPFNPIKYGHEKLCNKNIYMNRS